MSDDRGLLWCAALIAVLTLITLALLVIGLPEHPACRPAGHTVGCER